MRSFLRHSQNNYFKWLILRSILFVCATLVLFAAVSSFLLTAENNPPQKLEDGLPAAAVMQQLLAQYEDMSVQELFDARYEKRDFVEELSFDPTKSRYFDLISEKLKLTDQELDIYRRQGYVSVDHSQRYSFGAAYYQIYSADLPVFITSDSVMNAWHQSFDALLAELETNVMRRNLANILKACHETLAATSVPDELEDNRQDIDLYLTVARYLLAEGDAFQNGQESGSWQVASLYEQDNQARRLVELVHAERIQIPGQDAPTAIYGGERYVDYSQFRPRGHYTKSLPLSSYFRCMMWLSRADCGFFVLPTDPEDGLETNPDRELRSAALLSLILDASGRRANFESMTRLLASFVGESDNLTLISLHEMLKQHGILRAAHLANLDRLQALATSIEKNGVASQRIRSQVLLAPKNVPYTMPNPALVQMFGHSFAIDALVLANVVYDSIFYHDEKVWRMMPMGLDVIAALGNDEALLLLEPELEKWNYSGNLMAASEFVDRCKPEFWESRLYNIWLDALRTLDDEFEPGQHVPESMRTEVWQKKQLQTQLASWSELRHDTVLIAKQSFTGVPSCDYPAGYVEPYPGFYRKLKQFAGHTRESLVQLYGAQQALETGAYPRHLHERHLEFFGRAIQILGTLETITRKELAAQELTSEEELFLTQTIDRRGSLPLGSGSKPRYDGWFCDLFYQRDDVLEWNPTIADVHTYPDPFGVPAALEVGVGDVNFCVIAVNCKEKSTAYVGPVYSYYEFSQPANDRLTDSAWQQKIISSRLPQRPEWTRDFQGDAVKRTVDNLAVTLKDNQLRLNFARHNQLPEMRTFPNSDEGIAELVDYITTQGLTGRLSLDFSLTDITGKSLEHLEKLPNLAYIAVPPNLARHEATDRFREARPDVEVRPEKLRMLQASLCDAVSGYGVYQPVTPNSLKTGDKVFVYAELGGVSVSGGMNGFQHTLQMSCRLMNSEEATVTEQKFPEVQWRSEELPRTFYLAEEVQLPDDLAAGVYRMQIRISDNSLQHDIWRARLRGPMPEDPPPAAVETSIEFTISRP